MIGNDMIVYDKFEYQIKKLEKEDGIEIFEYFTRYRLGDKKNTYEYSKQRTKLKNQINEALNYKYHVPLGIYKEDKLIGICFSHLNKVNSEIPELTYFHIEPEFRNNISQYILFNYIINILYEDMNIRMKNNMFKEYGSIVRELPSIIGFSMFNDKFKNNLKTYFKDK